MRATDKRLLAALGAQAGALVAVLLLGGLARLGTIPAPVPATVVVRVPTQVPTVVYSYIYVRPHEPLPNGAGARQ